MGRACNQSFLSILFLLGLILVLSISNAFAQQTSTVARQALLYDMDTGAILFEKNADERMPTSSMSKVLTMLVVFDALRDGRLKLDDTLPVSEKAWRKGGSRMFVEHGRRVRVDDLIKGVIVQSGNDATIVLAEGIAGSEEAFVTLLNEKARQIGMSQSNFKNASGWPDDEHYSTTRDLLKLAKTLIEDYSEFYHYYSIREFTFNNIKQNNRNPLLFRAVGADGIKTGHTNAAGYGLMASAVQNGRRLVLIINGLESQRLRTTESARLLGWGFSEFSVETLYRAGDILDTAMVWKGQQKLMPLTVKNDLKVSVPRGKRDKVKMKIRMAEPVKAPIAAGQVVGEVIMQVDGLPETVVQNIVAAQTIHRAGFFGRIWQKLNYFLFGVGA